METLIELMFEELFQQADDLIMVIHISRKIEFINDKASDALQINSSSNYLNLDPVSYGLWDKFIKKIKEDKNANCRVNVLSNDGSYKSVKLIGYYIPQKQSIFARVILNPDKKVIKKKVEVMLPFNQMIKCLAQGVILTSMNGKLITANDKALELLGKEEWQIVNRSHDCLFEDFNNDTKSILHYYRQVSNNELATLIGVKQDENRNTSYFNFESKIDSSLNVLITTITDETEKIALLEKIEHQQSLNDIGQLAASIAHEIRNPMTSLQGFLQLIKGQTDEEGQRYFMIMESELQRIDILVSDLLNLSKPTITEFEYISFLDVVKEVIDLMQSQAVISDTIIEFQYDELSDYSIIGNKTRLKQMAINIVKNAIEATDSGGSINLQLLATAEHTIEFIVRDGGKGMDQHVLENLFNPFYTTKTAGTGLGLVLVKKVIEEHNGTIDIQSEVGKGSVFKIVLEQFNDHSANYFRHLELYGEWSVKSKNMPIL